MISVSRRRSASLPATTPANCSAGLISPPTNSSRLRSPTFTAMTIAAAATSTRNADHPMNKYPPAKPGVFIMRAKPYVPSHASCGVGTACHLHRPSYPHRYKSVSFSFSYSCHPLYLHFFLLPNYISTAIFTSISQLAKLFLPLHS